jgi:hypothetical protein
METTRITAVPAASRGEVTTFYSYDASSARSLALAHAAWQLAGRDGVAGVPNAVLMIDWDLHSPGLHGVFPGLAAGRGPDARTGVLELFEACRERLRAAGRDGTEDTEALAVQALDGLDWDSCIERVDDTRPLYLMRAGRFDDSYGERADGFDWDGLFCACPALFRAFAGHLAQRFSHVLIDCCSGRSAATSVCTALLPDKMVGLFTPDGRSLDGMRGVVARALDYRCSHEDDQRPLLVYPLPSPVEAGTSARLRWRFGEGRRADARHPDAYDEGYQAALENLLSECYGLSAISLDSYLDEVQLPLAHVVGAPAPGVSAPGAGDRLGPARAVEALLEWLEPGHFPWRPLAEVRLIGAVNALRVDADDPEAPDLVREMARLAQSYLGQQEELEAARRIEQHVIALEQGLHAMEEGQRGAAGLGAGVRRAHGATGAGATDDLAAGDPPGADPLDDSLSRLQELIDNRSPREARELADSLRSAILRPSVAHPLRRRGAAMIKQVYLQEGDKDALLAFTQDVVSSLEGALDDAAGG